MQNLVWVVVTVITMTSFLSYLLIYIYGKLEALTFRQYSVSVLLLAMMGSMLNSIIFYVDSGHGFLDTVLAVNISMVEMTAAIIFLLWKSVTGRKIEGGSEFAMLVSFLVLWNEISMGLLVYSLAFPSDIHDYSGSVASFIPFFFSSGVNTFLFIIPMSFEMALLLVLFHRKSEDFFIYASLVVMSLFSPVLSGNGSFVIPGLLVTAFAMVAFMVIFFEKIVRGKHSLKEFMKKSLTRIFFVFLLMMAGEFLGSVLNYDFAISWSFYALAMVASMFFYFHMTFSSKRKDTKRAGWLKDKKFIFYILLFSFASEWFVAAALSFAVPGYPLPGARGFVAFSNTLGGVTSFTTASSLFDSVYLIGAVTNGYWFLLLMGLEMGSLVLIRSRSLAWKEKRVNLYLALTAFFLYTLAYPNFGNERLYAIFPFWANVGSLGPLFPALLFSLAGSYVLYAVLALLFGRRSYCSTLCPSAVMYGGTLGQSMISFNYESGFSRRNIGSRFRGWVYPVIYNSWILIIVTAAISYVSGGGSGLSLWGVDVSVFYSYFVWNLLWYAFFIAIPFVGMSPCRRYGWCSTGTFVGLFSRLGLFRLKVRSPDTCVQCRDKPCVTACEVGLGDLPGQFIRNGFFKSSKCVGAGSCITACPYDNIYFYDLRNYIRERKNKRERV